MQYSMVKLSEVVESNKDFLLHSEFYKPDILKFRRKALKENYVPLGDLVGYIKRGTQPDYSKDGTIKVLRSANIQSHGVNDIRQEFVERDFFERKKQGQVKQNDVLLTSTGVGTLGRSVIIKNTEPYFIDGHVTILRDLKNVLPGFLYAYLNSKYGQKQIEVFYKGSSGQIEIYPDDIKNILIKPLAIQSKIADVVDAAFAQQFEAEEEYMRANALLEADLNLNISEFSNAKCFIKPMSDIVKAGRIDAEYFQPKYDKILRKIREYHGGYDELGQLIHQRDKNFYPDKEKEHVYIELSNISQNGVVLSPGLYKGRDLPTRARRKVNCGDVIVSSIEGALDKVALITDDYDGAICSTGFYVLYSDFFNPETLFCLMKSAIVTPQLKKGCSGTILTAINADELSKILLPKIDKQTQLKIQDTISNMYRCTQKSKQLLEIAISAVEIAISKTEMDSLDWMNKQLHEVGITNI